MPIHSTNATTADYRAYTEAFRDGVRSAALTREVANAHAHAMPVKDGDAFLAGYYAGLRRMRRQREDEAFEAEHERYRAAGRGRLVR